MRRTLLLTNDFPPRAGGIQSYVQALAERLPAARPRGVRAAAGPGTRNSMRRSRSPIYRHPGWLMLPDPSVRARAIELVRDAADRGSLVRRGGTAGHARARAAGGGVAPDGGQRARPRGRLVDGCRAPAGRCAASARPTTSSPSSATTRGAGSPQPSGRSPHSSTCRPECTPMPSAPIRRPRARVRARHGIGDNPLLVCVSRLVTRKGQDQLIRALPAIARAVPGVRLLIVGDGPTGAGVVPAGRADGRDGARRLRGIRCVVGSSAALRRR